MSIVGTKSITITTYRTVLPTGTQRQACFIFYAILKKKYIKFPSTKQYWQQLLKRKHTLFFIYSFIYFIIIIFFFYDILKRQGAR